MHTFFDYLFHNRFNQDMRKTSNISLGTKGINVRVVPVLRDNYSYILYRNNSSVAPAARKLALIDVSSDFEPVLRECKDILGGGGDAPELSSKNISLWGTHKHWDHVGGFAEMAKRFGGNNNKDLRVVGGEHEPIPEKNEDAKEGTPLKFDDDLVIDVYHVPFHTRGHVLFHFYHPEEKEKGAVFTGDAIFVGGGVGACFDGKTSEVISCFRKAAKNIPLGTSIFCGHNYMQNFINYAKSLQPGNKVVELMAAKCQEQNSNGMPTVPTTMGQELSASPFFKAAIGDSEFMKNVVPEKERGNEELTMEWVFNNCP